MSDFMVQINPNCLEVISTRPVDEGRRLGYVIFFAGGWDAWAVSPYDCQSMRQVMSNLTNYQAAVTAVVEFAFSFGMARQPR